MNIRTQCLTIKCKNRTHLLSWIFLCNKLCDSASNRNIPFSFSSTENWGSLESTYKNDQLTMLRRPSLMCSGAYNVMRIHAAYYIQLSGTRTRRKAQVTRNPFRIFGVFYDLSFLELTLAVFLNLCTCRETKLPLFIPVDMMSLCYCIWLRHATVRLW